MRTAVVQRVPVYLRAIPATRGRKSAACLQPLSFVKHPRLKSYAACLSSAVAEGVRAALIVDPPSKRSVLSDERKPGAAGCVCMMSSLTSAPSGADSGGEPVRIVESKSEVTFVTR